MDLKETLLLPKTDFPMRGNLGVREEEFQAKWEELNLYERNLALNKGNEAFILHDGPPYANGPIHIGHALNKVIKDFVIRYKTMQGFYTPYIPGWDTHGLPIETALQKKGVNRKNYSLLDYRKKCALYALEQIAMQKAQFKRLGVLGEWDNPYITLEKSYIADQLRVFAKMVKKDLIYKGLKPVFWSPASETALAEAEIVYKDVESPSLYVAFKIKDENYPDSSLLIWTTTPWTLPANLAVSVHPRFTYLYFSSKQGNFIVAESLYQNVVEKLQLTDLKIIKKIKGEKLEYLNYYHPLNDKVLPVILGEHVLADEGTGLVHTAPGHGDDDYAVGMKYQLDILVPIDDRGIFTQEGGAYEGLYYLKANDDIIADLKAKKLLLHLSYFKHSYPHDWRSDTPVIFRATPQWFSNIASIKEDLLREIEAVDWVQKWGKLRISNMVKDRQDWCISRQRTWGVPIPVFYTEKNTAILDEKVINHLADIVEEEGLDAWFLKDAKELLPASYQHPDSPSGIFSKETDTMDVWFDSGSSYQILKRHQLSYPADLYSEGSDQYRGWFNSSLTTGTVAYGKAPYKAVISHGFVLDEKGIAMSKSKGNTVDPTKVSKQLGADILRLWVSSVDYFQDVKIGPETLKQNSESYRKIRNTFRFMIANLFDFSYQENKVPFEEMDNLAKMMLVKLEDLKEKTYQAYDHYRFDLVNRYVTNYMTNDLSAYYFDYSKDILYVEAQNSLKRRTAQTVIYQHLMTILKLLNPLIPHTTSEVYWLLPWEKKADIYLERMDEVVHYQFDLRKEYQDFMVIRDEVLKTLELLRQKGTIGKSLEAALTIYLPQEMLTSLNKLAANYQQVLMVASIKFVESEKLVVEATLASGVKCERCWNIVEKVNEDHLCERCEGVLNENLNRK